MRLPRKLKKALKKWFSFDRNALCLRYHGQIYLVSILHNGKLFIDKPFYNAAPVSLQELSFALQLEDRLIKLQNFGIYE